MNTVKAQLLASTILTFDLGEYGTNLLFRNITKNLELLRKKRCIAFSKKSLKVLGFLNPGSGDSS